MKHYTVPYALLMVRHSYQRWCANTINVSHETFSLSPTDGNHPSRQWSDNAVNVSRETLLLESHWENALTRSQHIIRIKALLGM